MKNTTEHAGTLEIIERLPNSRNGNPRYLCRCDGWTFRTAPDSSLAHKMTNYAGKRVIVLLGTYYGKCTLCAIRSA